MPIAPEHPLGNSGTGQGRLTDEQVRVLAELYYRYKSDEQMQAALKEMQDRKDGKLDPGNDKFMEHNRDRAYNKDPQQYYDDLAKLKSLTNNGGAEGGYAFPQTRPMQLDPNGQMHLLPNGSPDPDRFELPPSANPNPLGDQRHTVPPPGGWSLNDGYGGAHPAKASIDGTHSGSAHYGTLTEDQAAAFRMMMLVQGHNASVTGRGSVREVPTKNGPAKAEM